MPPLPSVPCFLFPIKSFTPALAVGVFSMVLLAIALIAIYRNHLSGAWRWIFVTLAVAALWVNIFVLIAQAFQKVAALHALAPNGNEPPFLIAEGLVLLAFFGLGFLAANKFRPVFDLKT